jgi:hypothetical protein
MVNSGDEIRIVPDFCQERAKNGHWAYSLNGECSMASQIFEG